MKKLLSFAIAVVGLMLCSASCSKISIPIVRYGFDANEIKELTYVIGHEKDAEQFIEDLNAVTRKFDGTEFTEGEIVAAYDKVVNQHNHKFIAGTFSLYRYDVETDEKIATVKTWTMDTEG